MYIRPLLEYGDVVSCNLPLYIYSIKTRKKKNIEAARIVTGAKKLVGHGLLYRETGCRLDKSRQNHRVLFFIKCFII